METEVPGYQFLLDKLIQIQILNLGEMLEADYIEKEIILHSEKMNSIKFAHKFGAGIPHDLNFACVLYQDQGAQFLHLENHHASGLDLLNSDNFPDQLLDFDYPLEC